MLTPLDERRIDGFGSLQIGQLCVQNFHTHAALTRCERYPSAFIALCLHASVFLIVVASPVGRSLRWVRSKKK